MLTGATVLSLGLLMAVGASLPGQTQREGTPDQATGASQPGAQTAPANQPASAGTQTASAKKGRSAGGDVGSGSGDIGKGAGRGAGSLAKGTGKGAADLATLHPVNAAGDLGKGGVVAGKDAGVGAAKGGGKIAKGTGRGIGKGLKKVF